jgi:hypothetical protein
MGVAKKIIAAGPIPPLAGEERDPGKRTMGGLVMSAPKKLSLQDLYLRLRRYGSFQRPKG